MNELQEGYLQFLQDNVLGPARPLIKKSWIPVLTGPLWPEFNNALWEVYCKLSTYKSYGTVQSLIAPHPSSILKAFYYCEIYDVKVVIMGMDPYNSPGVATGLSFQSKERRQPSLSNIEKALGHPLEFEYAASQGVLFLNAALTSIQCKSTDKIRHSHCALWTPFTRKLIDYMSRELTDITFMLWGNDAQSIIPFIYQELPVAIPDDRAGLKIEDFAHNDMKVRQRILTLLTPGNEWRKGRHDILTWTHPSPTINNKLPKARQFENCPHFALTKQIRWHSTDRSSSDNDFPELGKYRATNLTTADILSKNIDERVKYSQWLLYNYPVKIQNLIAYTDGAAMNNGAADCKSTWAFIIIDSMENIVMKDCGLVPGDHHSNNRGELWGIGMMLMALKPYQRVVVYTDSNWSLQVLKKYTPSHIERGDKGWNATANLDIIEQIKPYLWHVIEFRHVKGHNGDKWNTIVDALANQAKAIDLKQIKPDDDNDHE
jgi:uracil-DNA glycosylase